MAKQFVAELLQIYFADHVPCFLQVLFVQRTTHFQGLSRRTHFPRMSETKAVIENENEDELVAYESADEAETTETKAPKMKSVKK